MFVRTRERGHRIEEIIPSYVSVERAEEGDQIGVNSLASCEDLIIEILRSGTNREIDPLSITPPQQDGGIADGLIKRVPKVIENMGCGEAQFTWWTENGTAKSDLDFVAWGRRVEHMKAGQSSTTLLIPIIKDSTRTSTRTFHVVIGESGGGKVSGTTRAEVRLSGAN